MTKSHKHSKTISTKKEKIRQELKQIRSKLSGRAEKSAAIVEKLLARPEITSSSHILCYYPSTFEVDIVPLIKILFKQHKQLYLPHMDRQVIGRFSNFDELEVHRFGDIRIPNNELEPESYNLIQVAIIPGLAFTTTGNRLGHGSGWYDRLLPHLPQDLIKIGVCFNEQILPELPTEKHDIKMDLLISD